MITLQVMTDYPTWTCKCDSFNSHIIDDDPHCDKCSCTQELNTMRYFYISYYGYTKDGTTQRGSVSIESEGFPDHVKLRQQIYKLSEYRFNKVIILNLLEMTKGDFEKWTASDED